LIHTIHLCPLPFKSTQKLKITSLELQLLRTQIEKPNFHSVQAEIRTTTSRAKKEEQRATNFELKHKHKEREIERESKAKVPTDVEQNPQIFWANWYGGSWKWVP